jgi:hypothetical protein
MLSILLVRLPAWAQWVVVSLVAAWGVGAMVSIVMGSLAMVDAVSELARIHSRALAVQSCQVAIRDKSAYWLRRVDGLCHIEDLQASNSTTNR